MARFHVSPKFAGFIIASVMKIVGATLRWRVDDRGGWLERPMPGEPVLWLCWHNRIFLAPMVHWNWFRSQPAAVLASASRDGELLAAVCRNFGLDAARGSSSRRGAAALRESVVFLKAKRDLCVTPDGPRGPRYHLQQGIVILAQRTGTRILPLHLRPHRAWRLKTWDGFVIPWPFTRVDVVLDPPWIVPLTTTPEEFEFERARLETMLRAGTGDEPAVAIKPTKGR